MRFTQDVVVSNRFLANQHQNIAPRSVPNRVHAEWGVYNTT